MMIPRRSGDYLTVPRKTLLGGGVLALLFIVGAFFLGRSMIEAEARTALVEVHELRDQMKALTIKNDALLKEKAFADSARMVDQASVLDAQHAMAELQNELNRVKGQLAFYRRIVSPEDQVKGLYVQGLELSGPSENGVYGYRLIVAQSLKKQPFVKGTLSFILVGRDGGKARELKLSDVLTGGDDAVKFGFRYFQLYSGQFRLPEGFQPQQIKLDVQPSTKGRDGVSQQWQWSEAFATTANPQTN